jgi:excisionase family DNA binding protein
MSEEASSIPRLNLSVDEAALALGVCPKTVRALIARRELRAVRIGRRVLVSVSTLQAFVTSRESESV